MAENRSLILIVAGGTGGHILPGIRVGEFLEAQHGANFRVGFACGTRPIEKEIYESESRRPHVLPVGQNAGNPLKRTADLTRGLVAAFRLLRTERPAGVLAMGGAVCFPVLAAAVVLRIPIFLHESNRIPGRVIRLFSRFARRVYLGLGGLEGANVRVVGTPTKRAESDPSADRDLIFCVGGSQGASKLNQMFCDAVEKHLTDLPHQFILIAGPGKTVEGATRTEVRGYEPNLPILLSRAALCVSRSGAGAMADIANFRVPSVLVPYPFAMDNHQAANARVYGDARAASVLEEGWLTAERLAVEIRRMATDAQTLEEMRHNLAAFDSSESAGRIVEDLLQHLEPARHAGLSAHPQKASL